jgi:1,2-dihydroxy-3-keto-5-methylthiopentene dioxygenase
MKRYHTPDLQKSPQSNLTVNQGVDQRENHDSGRDVPEEYLAKLGVLYYRYADEGDVDALARERSYKNRDMITISPEKMGDIYEETVKMFFNEHLHEDEEIRYMREGTGFFDVRSEGDEWVRIQLEKDDLIVSLKWESPGCNYV